MSFCLALGGNKAQIIFDNLSNISHEDVIFDVTKGDDKEYSEVINKNKKLFSSARATFVWTNLQAIVASLVAAGIFEYFKS